MKKFISRLSMMFAAVFTMAIIATLPVTSFAAEQEAAPVAISEEVSINEASDNDLMTVQAMVDEGTVIQPLGATPATGGGSASGSGGATPATGGGSASGSGEADTAYKNVMDVILIWIRRVGAAVALFGGIMLALGIKRDEADQKENGIKTMVAGFVVWAICGAVGLFHLFD